jgi:hypothetical protein
VPAKFGEHSIAPFQSGQGVPEVMGGLDGVSLISIARGTMRRERAGREAHFMDLAQRGTVASTGRGKDAIGT